MYPQINSSRKLKLCFITPGKYTSVVEYDGKLVIQQVQTEVRFWSLVLCNGNAGNEPYSVACQGSLPFFCMAKLMVVTSTAQINMSVVAWHSTITVCAWKHWWDFLEGQNCVNQCDVVHMILRSRQNSMNT